MPGNVKVEMDDEDILTKMFELDPDSIFDAENGEWPVFYVCKFILSNINLIAPTLIF